MYLHPDVKSVSELHSHTEDNRNLQNGFFSWLRKDCKLLASEMVSEQVRVIKR